ncbi:hypothetical protein [Streptomyces sp. NPDC093589]|uniref:hypothetical protein n=1 Tax=Streptomyces sp. NPDC093589 TaxID=3366043 RepID=UPI00381258DF
MRELMRSLITRLRKRRIHPAPTVAYRPQRPPLHRPLRLGPPESPLDGDASPLVRPYLLAYEDAEARREQAFLREMAVAS